MSPGQTGHITGQMGRVPGTDGTHTRGRPAKILYVYWFFLSPFTCVGHPQTCVDPDVCLGIGDVSGKAPLPGQGAW